MAQYYYFISQLPYLMFGAPPPFNSKVFLSSAQPWLTQTDWDQLSQAQEAPLYLVECSTGPGAQYARFDFELRTVLGHLRKASGQKGYLFPALLQQALEQPSPLAREKAILKIYWDFLEDMGACHYFDSTAITVYFFKLRILERLVIFEKEKGTRVFQDLYRVSFPDPNNTRDER